MIVLLVALGAVVGAPARFLVDRAVQQRHESDVPWGTFTVNVVASLVLGVLGGAAGHVSVDLQALVATGFCGALSTFSTFSVETVRLARTGRWWPATANVVMSVLAGLGAVAIGWAIGATM